MSDVDAGLEIAVEFAAATMHMSTAARRGWRPLGHLGDLAHEFEGVFAEVVFVGPRRQRGESRCGSSPTRGWRAVAEGGTVRRRLEKLLHLGMKTAPAIVCPLEAHRDRTAPPGQAVKDIDRAVDGIDDPHVVALGRGASQVSSRGSRGRETPRGRRRWRSPGLRRRVCVSTSVRRIEFNIARGGDCEHVFAARRAAREAMAWR
jgi:hypothetical protein